MGIVWHDDLPPLVVEPAKIVASPMTTTLRRPTPSERICASYIRDLQLMFHEVDNRGIVFDPVVASDGRAKIEGLITKNLDIISRQWGVHVYIGAENALPKKDPRTSYNLNASSGDKKLVNALHAMGYDVPKVTVKNDGEYEQRESAGELAIRKMLQSPAIALKGGDPALMAILDIREMSTLINRYFNCNFYENLDGLLLFLTNYNVVGTLTGRRGSRKHVFQFGNNAQNIPKHGSLARLYRSCLVARPGNILVSVDQMSAEEWPVACLANNQIAIKELIDGTDRHTKLASGLFNIPIDSRTREEWKESIERYLGKKTRHANNYGMKGQTMSDSLAKEGIYMTYEQCQAILDSANKLEPNIQGVFHAYVKTQIADSRMLVTPLGRERQFLNFRPNAANVPQFNEAFSWIPQSVVGDNNGLAAYRMERHSSLPLVERFLIHENHDSLTFDVPDNLNGIMRLLEELRWAYDRPITFHNGMTINIPVEAEIGYNMAGMISLKRLDRAALEESYNKLHGAKAT